MRTSKKNIVIFLLLAIVLSACTSPSTELAETPRPDATVTPFAAKKPTQAVSSLNVEKEALRGAQVTVWHAWFGAEASLFESQVEEFNKINEWGIVVSAESKTNFSELFSQTDAALKNATKTRASRCTTTASRSSRIVSP